MLLPCVQAGQQGGEAHDVPGLSISHLGGLVGQKLHTRLCQEAWEGKRKALVSTARERRIEKPCFRDQSCTAQHSGGREEAGLHIQELQWLGR